jgi:hypothetical protein
MSRATASEDAGARFTVAKAAATLRPSRFTVFAAGFALAAALGALVGSLSASGLAQLWQPAPAKSATADAGLLQAMKVELAAMKASLDVAARSANSQVAKIADRLERVERSGSEPATKLTHIAESVDRLEKKSAAMATALEATGAIGATEAARTEPKITDRLLEGWIVQDVRRGRALVESREGGMFVVHDRRLASRARPRRGDQAAGRPMGRRHCARDNYVPAVNLRVIRAIPERAAIRYMRRNYSARSGFLLPRE